MSNLIDRIDTGEIMKDIAGWSIGLGVAAAWLTHVIVCIKAGAWGFLIAGAVFFPVAIVHGFGLWLGVF